MTSIKAQNVNHPQRRENLKVEKYTLIREAILAALPAADTGESMSFDELEIRVHSYLEQKTFDPKLFPKPGSVRWYTKAVQLDLEAKDLIERLPGVSPIQLRKKLNNI